MRIKKRTSIILVSVACVVGLGLGIGGYYIGKESKTVPTQSTNQGDTQISNSDIQKVKNLTTQYLNLFKNGNTIDDNKINNLVETYFTNDFLSNEYPKIKNDVIDNYEGLSGLVMQQLSYQKPYIGAVKGVTIADVQTDNVNDTITVYLRLDDTKQNDKQWIEWRNVPGEGWKIDSTYSLSLLSDGIHPISPKKDW
jgi:uncharacterized protein HemX